MVGYPTNRRMYHGHCAGQRRGGATFTRPEWPEGRRSPSARGDGPPSRGGAGGKPPQARPRGALRGSASSVTAVTRLWAPTRRCSAPVTRPCGPARHHTEYGGNQIFVKISS